MSGLVCHYAKHPGKIRCSPFMVRITFHDRRGCLHVCDAHAKWRMETSTIQGHGQDCPLRETR